MITNAYHVVFKDTSSSQGWSKGYTYRSDKIFKKGDVVVVPTGKFYSVGKVTDVKEKYEFKEPQKFKEVLLKLDVPAVD